MRNQSIFSFGLMIHLPRNKCTHHFHNQVAAHRTLLCRLLESGILENKQRKKKLPCWIVDGEIMMRPLGGKCTVSTHKWPTNIMLLTSCKRVRTKHVLTQLLPLLAGSRQGSILEKTAESLELNQFFPDPESYRSASLPTIKILTYSNFDFWQSNTEIVGKNVNIK